VAQLTSVLNTSLAIPQFADGGGWTTQVILVNPTDASISGNVELFSLGSVTSKPYSIPARSATTFETEGTQENIRTGWIRVTPAAATATPASLAVFRSRRGGVFVSETGVIGQPSGSSFNLYAETNGSLQSGVALANISPSPLTVTLEILSLAGTATGLTSVVVIPPLGQLGRFLTEFAGFEGLRGPFQGILKIRSPAGPLAVVGLRGRINERSDFLMATTPPLNNDVPASSEELVIPQFVDGSGYTTQFVLFSGNDGGSSGSVTFVDGNGKSPGVVLRSSHCSGAPFIAIVQSCTEEPRSVSDNRTLR
jgi:hypothetical protein